jgi:methylmalonyl-CoA/ethylmalonyl-CoA epimerase
LSEVFERINHVGIAVSDLEPALAHYGASFDCELLHRERLDGETIDAALVRAGEGRLELVAPLVADTPLARFVAKRGPAVHHLAYDVEDIEATIATLRERSVRMIDEQPRAGISGSRVAFVHPSSCFGVLTEIVESAR